MNGVITPAALDGAPGISASDICDELSAARAYTTLRSTVQDAAVVVSQANADIFDGLLRFVTEQVIFLVGQPTAGNKCPFSPNSWQKDANLLAELHVNVDARLGPSPAVRARVVFQDLLHQLAHAQNWLAGIQDRSRNERYHSAKFARTAVTLGLDVEADQQVGHRVVGVRPRALEYYAPQLQALESALVLTWSPKSDSESSAGISTGTATDAEGQPGSKKIKYVFATCNCVDGRRNRRAIRVATGWWALGPIACKVCGTAFAASAGDSATSPTGSSAASGAPPSPTQLELPMTSP